MGVLTPGFYTLNPPLSPPATPAQCFPPPGRGGGGSTNLKKFPINCHAILSLFFLKTPPKQLTPQGPGGVTQFLSSHTKSYLFCALKPHAKFGNPTITPSGGKLTTSKEREKDKPLGPKKPHHHLGWLFYGY
jgi:hypothetical protein